MQRRFLLVSFSLSFMLSFFSCTKHHDDVPIPPAPELADTLGAGWQRIKVDTTLNFEDILLVNNQIGFVCGLQYLGKSTEGGLTWKPAIPDLLKESFTNLFFSDSNHGWEPGTTFSCVQLMVE